MNLRNWSKEHTFGLLLGLATTIIMFPVLYNILNECGNHFNLNSDDHKSKLISLASIANLPAFHLFMKNKKYDYCMGLILATFVSLFVMFYYKF